MAQIAVFSAHMVLGVTKDNVLKLYNPPPLHTLQDHQYWLDVAQGVNTVAIGGGNCALWALGVGGKAYRHSGFFSGVPERLETLQTDWGSATGRFNTLAVGRVAPGEPVQVVGGEKVLGLAYDFSTPLEHDHFNNRWELFGPGQNSAISVGDDGTVVRLDTKGDLYRYDGGRLVWTGRGFRRDGPLTWTKLSQPRDLRSISVVSKTNMWAVGGGGEIYSTIV